MCYSFSNERELCMELVYEWMPSNMINTNESFDDLINSCSHLFSSQYGKWSSKAHGKEGENIKLSPSRIRKWLENENASIYWAKDNGELIGYAIAIQLDVPRYGIISWVTQLVVHENYRHRDVAKALLRSIWGFTDNFAWGIISANPYAIRALEKTTRRRSSPSRIKHNLKKILSIGIDNLPYINEETEAFVTHEASRINTEFYVDHSEVDEMISSVVTDTVPWTLGKLDEGWEWLAFTFQDQLPFELSSEEIEEMLKQSDKVVQNAYMRMNITNQHGWTNNTTSEVEFIFKECQLSEGDTLVDFGCGQGRHALQIAKCGINVIGVDYVDKNIELANKHKENELIENVEFILGDCREINIRKKADAAICVYDVIGTYAENEDNFKILENVARSLKEGGIAIISVMNLELTEKIAKNTFKLKEAPNKLLSLKPSNIMETSGNIFNPEYFLLDNETGIVYRREQFKFGKALPVEFIVRDKRFNMREIRQMCIDAGFEIVFSRFVNAKDWETGFTATSESSKEILLKCRKVR